MDFVADLHNHTTASDGEYTPSELVLAGKELGLQAIGVTDHDTLNGLDEALNTGREAGIQVVPGVEVSLRYRRPNFTGTLHYLLYIPYELLRAKPFRAQAMDIFSQGRGRGLIRARVAAINEVFGPEGKTPLLDQPLTVAEVEALAPQRHPAPFCLGLGEQSRPGQRSDQRLNRQRQPFLRTFGDRTHPTDTTPASIPAAGPRLCPSGSGLIPRRKSLQRSAAADRNRRSAASRILRRSPPGP